MKIVLKLTHIKSNKTLHTKIGHYGGNVSKFKDYAFKKKQYFSIKHYILQVSINPSIICVTNLQAGVNMQPNIIQV